MGVTIDLHLWGKPEWEMNLDKATAKDFRKKAKEFEQRLTIVATIVEKLHRTGWEHCGTLYGLDFFKEGIQTEKEARKELKRLQIDPREFAIHDFEDEGDEE